MEDLQADSRPETASGVEPQKLDPPSVAQKEGVSFVLASSVKDGIYVLLRRAPKRVPPKDDTSEINCDRPRQIEKGNDLVEEASSLPQETGDLATSLKQHLGSFSEKLEETRERIEDTAKCYQLMDKSYEWALDAMRFVSNMGINNTKNPECIVKQIQCLQDYSENHLKIPEDTFTEMMELATKLGNDKLLDQCKVVRERCNETVELVQARQSTLQRVKQQIEVDSLRGPFWEAEDAPRSLSQPAWLPSTPYSSNLASYQRRRSTGAPHPYGPPTGSYTSFPSSYYPTARERKEGGIILTAQGPTLSKTLLECRDSCSRDSTTREDEPKKLTRRWQLRDEALERAKAQVREQTALLSHEKRSDCVESPEKSSDRVHCHARSESLPGPVPVNTHLLLTAALGEEDAPESKSNKTLMNIMKELIQTERDYVNSLEYIIENYIPELTREDIPQTLRGQRNVIFGNIEKIYEFHNQYFLTELEHCESVPFTVGQCFLDFQTEFYLYALYNKNKPKSDALMSEYGNTFFKKMQIKLEDKMDLASYLLKPVQRMGKYALLLKELLKECPERETGHQALKRV